MPKGGKPPIVWEEEQRREIGEKGGLINVLRWLQRKKYNGALTLVSEGMDAARKRMVLELLDMEEASSSYMAGPIRNGNGEDIFLWRAAIMGYQGTPYEGGVWFLRYEFPTDYPFKPPKLSFVVTIYYPNLWKEEKGGMCLNILEEKSWSPDMTLSLVLQSLLFLLAHPKRRNLTLNGWPEFSVEQYNITTCLDPTTASYHDRDRDMAPLWSQRYMLPIVMVIICPDLKLIWKLFLTYQATVMGIKRPSPWKGYHYRKGIHSLEGNY